MTKPVIARNQKDDQRASLDAAARRWREQPAEDRAALIEDMANELLERAVAASVADEDPDRAKGLRREARVIAAALAIIKAAGGARP